MWQACNCDGVIGRGRRGPMVRSRKTLVGFYCRGIYAAKSGEVCLFFPLAVREGGLRRRPRCRIPPGLWRGCLGYSAGDATTSGEAGGLGSMHLSVCVNLGCSLLTGVLRTNMTREFASEGC